MKKVLIGLAIALVSIIILGIIIFGIVSATSKKLVCTSNEGNITIMYNNKSITGYTANGIVYNLDEQKEYAKQVGIESYLDEFSAWFKTNTTGSCAK